MNRGVIFSLVSVLISAFIFLLFWTANNPRLDQTGDAMDSRITVLDHYVGTWDSYIEDATRLSIRTALGNLTLRIPPKGSESVYSFGLVTDSLADCFMTGASDFEAATAEPCFAGKNSSLPFLLEELSILAKDELNIDTSYVLADDFAIDDWTPFEIKVNFTLNYTMGDPLFAIWNRSRRFTVIVSVDGLPDPLFQHYGEAWLDPPYTRRNISVFQKNRDLFNRSDIQAVFDQKRYYDSIGLGPTYLERFRGMISGDLDPQNSSGIETLIDPWESQVPASQWHNSSFTANQIFDDVTTLRCGIESFGIMGFTPPEFHLDVRHISRFNLNGSSTTLNYTCP